MKIQASEGVVFLLNLLLTFCIYTLPFIIIRFIIRKRPYTAAQAKRIVIIYGIAAWLIMSAVMHASNGSVAGGSIFLWSFINYKVLVSNSDNKNNAAAPENLPAKTESVAEVEAQNQRLYDEFCETYSGFPDSQLIMIAKSDVASDVCIKAAKHILETRSSPEAIENENEPQQIGTDNKFNRVGDEISGLYSAVKHKTPCKGFVSKKAIRPLLAVLIAVAFASTAYFTYSYGHSSGYDDGYSAGRKEGYANGLEVGKTEGYSNGYDKGHITGYIDGYTSGYNSDTAREFQDLWRAAVVDYIREYGAGN